LRNYPPQRKIGTRGVSGYNERMRVRVLFFGQLREITGFAEDYAELSEGARIEDLYERYGRRFPRLLEFRASVAASINQEYSTFRAQLATVSGGQQSAPRSADLFELIRSSIPIDEISRTLRAPEDGALVVFDGFARNNFRGRATLYLEYEAYEEMALAKIREIGAQMHEKFAIHRVAIVHRLGRVDIGETSILIAVSSPHRAAAFDACRYAIDTLKRTVPIWKKEFFTDGAIWADGEVPPPTANSAQGESIS
jgi:molybdopterin synthase catalytic subunit/molybdopterin converting factor small subunit